MSKRPKSARDGTTKRSKSASISIDDARVCIPSGYVSAAVRKHLEDISTSKTHIVDVVDATWRVCALRVSSACTSDSVRGPSHLVCFTTDAPESYRANVPARALRAAYRKFGVAAPFDCARCKAVANTADDKGLAALLDEAFERSEKK